MFGVRPTRRELPGLTWPGAHWSACGLGHSACCACSCWCWGDAPTDPVERSEGVSPSGSHPGPAMSQAGGKVDTEASRLGAGGRVGQLTHAPATWAPSQDSQQLQVRPDTEAPFQQTYNLLSVSRTGPHRAQASFLFSNLSSPPFTPERPALLGQSDRGGWNLREHSAGTVVPTLQGLQQQ